MNTFNTSVSGISAGKDRLETTAHNLANVNTDGFTRRRVTHQEVPTGGVTTTEQALPGGHPLAIREPVVFNAGGDTVELSNVDISDEMINLVISEKTTQANAKAVQTQDRMLDSVLDLI